jgi:acyl-CoA thioesterase-1
MMSSRRLLTCLIVLGTLLLAADASSRPWLVVALGDSNTAGYGVGRQAAFPAQLEAMLRMTGYDVQVLNAGVTGDTTGGMLARLDAAVPPGTSLVIVQGGYNDLLMGSGPGFALANTDAIVARLSLHRTKAILCGFFRPDWDAVGHAIAARYGATFIDGSLCYDSRFRGPDSLHMAAVGHQVVAERLLPVVQSLLVPTGRRHTFDFWRTGPPLPSGRRGSRLLRESGKDRTCRARRGCVQYGSKDVHENGQAVHRIELLENHSDIAAIAANAATPAFSRPMAWTSRPKT